MKKITIVLLIALMSTPCLQAEPDWWEFVKNNYNKLGGSALLVGAGYLVWNDYQQNYPQGTSRPTREAKEDLAAGNINKNLPHHNEETLQDPEVATHTTSSTDQFENAQVVDAAKLIVIKPKRLSSRMGFLGKAREEAEQLDKDTKDYLVNAIEMLRGARGAKGVEGALEQLTEIDFPHDSDLSKLCNQLVMLYNSTPETMEDIEGWNHPIGYSAQAAEVFNCLKGKVARNPELADHKKSSDGLGYLKRDTQDNLYKVLTGKR